MKTFSIQSPPPSSLKSALDSVERADLGRLEAVVERGLTGFVEVGSALLEISDRRLYRDTHGSFEEYCREKWSMTARRAYQLCEAAEVVKSLPESVNHGSQINERQARELAKVPESQRVEVLEAAGSKGTVTATSIAEAKRRVRNEQRIAAARGITIPSQIVIGDFRSLSGRVPDGSLSLIFTDPPYDRDSMPLFDELGKFASTKLAEGGSLITYVGHVQLCEAPGMLAKHLRFWWSCACVHGGGKALMREYGIRVGWKPMLWFVKGTRDDKTNIVFDTVTGETEKSHHDWQQSQREAAYYIEHLCPKDGIVCDPFLGGGTTAAAAISLGRKWIGFEINPETASIAATRLEVRDTSRRAAA